MSIDHLLEQALRLQNQGDFAQAEKLYSKALKSERDNPALWFNHGLTLRDLGEPKKALASFDQAQRLSPPRAEIENERGNALLALNRHEDALAALTRALALRPLYPGALINRGLALIRLTRPQEALADFDAALRLEPRMALALVNRGAALEKLNRPAEALAAYRQALAVAPDNVTALYQCGVLLARTGQAEESLAYFDHTLTADPDLAAARLFRARALLVLKRVGEAHAEMKHAFAKHPNTPFIFDGLLETSLMACDFAQREALEPTLVKYARAGVMPAPLRLLQCSDDPALQRDCAIAYVKNQYGVSGEALAPRRVASGRRLKLAYLSYDLRNHAVAISAAAVLERHDRSRFELFAVSTGPDDSSPMRRRIAGGVEHFLDVAARGDDAVARLLAAAEIDILVDLGGHTDGARPGIAARRPVPLQVNWLGWAGTTGATFIDYMIADPVVAPPGSDGFFTEMLVRLPHCYHATDPGRDPFAAAMTRSQAGLPEDSFVFCALNGNWKISPPVFRLWMELLQDVPGSVLWLRYKTRRRRRLCGRKRRPLASRPSGWSSPAMPRKPSISPAIAWAIFFSTHCLSPAIPPPSRRCGQACRW